MSELNPYEPPQSESKPSFRQKPLWPSRNSLLLDWVIPPLLGSQMIFGVLRFAFDFMQVMTDSSYQHRQSLTEFFSVSFFVLGYLVFTIEIICGSMKLVIFEVLFMAVFLWLNFQVIG